MKFCSECGHTVSERVPEGDNRLRFVCDECQTVHYRNPNIVAGTLPIWEDKVLLCKRAIEPRYGTWTLPAGFMELGETMEQAALRESEEEACANVQIDDIYTLISLPHVNQVYVMYRAQLLDLNFRAGDESLEVRLFTEQEIPWGKLAFRTIHYTLEKYFADRRQGHFPVYTHTITANNRSPAE
jgi:ADP-ribose pyrophosphatase YjhB (NUDIX family)